MNHYIFEYNKYKNTISEISKSIETDDEKKYFSQFFCSEILHRFWTIKTHGYNYSITSYNFNGTFEIDSLECVLELSNEMAKLLSDLDINSAGYYIGNIYTTLLPKKHRAKIGAYYTPPVLVDRLMSTIDNNNFDWSNSKIIDPACGGAAFLGALSIHLIEKLSNKYNEKEIVNIINKNLSGYEIDSFAAWISQTLLELSTFPYFKEKGIKINKIVHVQDSLDIDNSLYDSFDLVIGNPPYGKIKLNDNLKLKYKRSLYGHANLYGLFMDLAVRLAKKNGYVAFVTPTSFLGGHYFKKLRELLVDKAPLVNIDFIEDRNGVFSDVLQETALATFCKSKDSNNTSSVNEIKTSNSLNNIEVNLVGSFKLNKNTDKPWLLPRTKKQLCSFYKAVNMNLYLADYGYEINTGQLVWNRHKSQLRRKYNRSYYPLIWAESILPDGKFLFQARRKNHVPYIKVKSDQQYLITNEESILVQRTTSKEQDKRIIAAILDKSFLNKYTNGVVIENHINIIKKKKDSILSIEGLNYLLNSKEVDEIFRCISGSVAVSAYEINSIPLPPFNDILKLEDLISKNKNKKTIDDYITKIYGALLNDTKRNTKRRTNI